MLLSIGNIEERSKKEINYIASRFYKTFGYLKSVTLIEYIKQLEHRAKVYLIVQGLRLNLRDICELKKTKLKASGGVFIGSLL